MREFVDEAAKRERVPLWLGIMGPSGGGKTYSALRLATGIASVTGGSIHVIDTEARRGLHYAGDFDFRHVDFSAPFGSLDYLAAVRHCTNRGASVVIIDSMSHEHEGDGGCLDVQEHELERLTGGDVSRRDRLQMLAWKKPKADRSRMINGLLQMNVNIIMCFRAKERVKPKRSNGRTEMVEMGYMPIAGVELVYEMTACALLMPRANGVPTWMTEQIGERQMMKLPKQFESILQANRQLSEDVGVELAQWARGGEKPTITQREAEVMLAEAAAAGTTKLKQVWTGKIPAALRKTLQGKLDQTWKPIAAKMDTLSGAPA